ncbi:MAG: DNA recombination protein RmuC [Chitinivibrionales bacterium]|nr:DNA recombination protein RmuC [Chitinivibrionales bacterium]MBD3395882.1 DNA recombination protein RmuC [Chitinivibrionales bacterium]
MLTPVTVIAFVLGIAIGAAAAWLFLRDRIRNAGAHVRSQFEPKVATLTERLDGKEELLGTQKSKLAEQENEIRRLNDQITSLKSTQSQLETTIDKERRAAQEKLEILNEAQKKLSDAFKSLSADALKSNNESFLELARTTLEKYQESAKDDLGKKQQAIDEMIKPVKEALEKFDGKIGELEKARVGAYEGLREQVRGLLETQTQLRQETGNLVKALSSPRVYGRWGEVQLKRLVELAGMVDHCDFREQQSIDGEQGPLRPDMVVMLPAGKTIVVDVKVPMGSYLEALGAENEEARQTWLKDHIRLVTDHMTALSRKSYWDQFDQTPEFVVMFLPNETFFTAALEQDPTLIEKGARQRVILATPTTLIALLKAIAYGWRQERLAENAKVISELGSELYKRLADMGGHLAELGSRLGKAVESYNKTIGSLESRVLVSARRFEELSVTAEGKQIESLQPLEQTPRHIQAPEISGGE